MSCLRSSLRFCFVTAPIFLWDGLRLFLYTLVLSPAFVRFAWYYWVTSNRTVVKYNTQSMRQTLDVYRPAKEIHHNDDAASHERLLLEDDVPTTENPNRHSSSTEFPLVLQEPVVFFCCGGAWMIGYKMWGALLARVLTATGLTVVVPDYRNYPFWGAIPDQVADVEAALQWTLDHTSTTTTTTTAAATSSNSCNALVRLYAATEEHRDEEKEGTASTAENNTQAGARSNRLNRNIVVVGQSAGGHLLTTLLLRKAVEKLQSDDHQSTCEAVAPSGLELQQRAQEGVSSSFAATDVSGLISLSAPCNLNAMRDTFRKHGLDEHVVDRMFGGVKDDYDPFVILQRTARSCNRLEEEGTGEVLTSLPTRQLCDYLPPIKIYHGSRDRTVPSMGSVEFTEKLQAQNIDATFHMYDGWSHTDPILEGPMDADHRFHRDIFDAVVEWTNDTEHLQWPEHDDSNHPPNRVMRRLCPHALVQAGRFFMPF
jgi:acetyl esterase/lipase